MGAGVAWLWGTLSWTRSKVDCRVRGARPMADLAYAVLLIGVFLLLALCVRGLEKL
ncbi:hypothetical protein CLV40_13024 [Actinokineospora auranticolor]|uniref:Uncharacterized protein n=1 Tax=Actinokineospora auranticolor TaxID=155976 RepID=A0A2S6GDD4_9PSEU|nr:hypothetical protein CLV40_13024 [Actinokineospora auranticolor]